MALVDITNAMKPLSFLIGFALLITLARCGQSGAAREASPENVPLALPDTLDLAYQDTLFFSEQQDWLTFDGLVHDSRCPTGVRCIWEGNAEVTFAFSQDGRQHAFTLNTHPTYTTDTTLADLTVALLDLMPYPHGDSTYQAEQFLVRIFVIR